MSYIIKINPKCLPVFSECPADMSIEQIDQGGGQARFFGNETVNAVESIQDAFVVAGIATLLKEISDAKASRGLDA